MEIKSKVTAILTTSLCLAVCLTLIIYSISVLAGERNREMGNPPLVDNVVFPTGDSNGTLDFFIDPNRDITAEGGLYFEGASYEENADFSLETHTENIIIPIEVKYNR